MHYLLDDYKKNKIPSDLLIKYCLINKISIDWLLTGKGSMNREEVKPQGQGTTEDIELVKEIMLLVEEAFDMKDLYLPPNKKVELIFLMYDYIKEGRFKRDEMKGEVIKLADFAKGC